MRLDDNPDLGNNYGLRLARIVTRDDSFAKWEAVIGKLLMMPPQSILDYIGLMGTIDPPW